MKNINIKFPDIKPLTLISVSLSANSTSSYRDSMNLCKLTKEKWNSHNIILTDNDTKIQGNNHDEIYNFIDGKSFLKKIEDIVLKMSTTHDIIFTISAHGYSKRGSSKYEIDQRDEYIKIRRSIILDHDIRNSFYKNMNDDCKSLCLIDTCHSGTMLDLPYYSYDGDNFRYIVQDIIIKPKSYCISACDDNELAGEDISYYSGFGGKLTCCFLDYINDKNKIDVIEFYKKALNIFEKQGNQCSHPILSTTDKQD